MENDKLKTLLHYQVFYRILLKKKQAPIIRSGKQIAKIS